MKFLENQMQRELKNLVKEFEYRSEGFKREISNYEYIHPVIHKSVTDIEQKRKIVTETINFSLSLQQFRIEKFLENNQFFISFLHNRERWFIASSDYSIEEILKLHKPAQYNGDTLKMYQIIKDGNFDIVNAENLDVFMKEKDVTFYEIYTNVVAINYYLKDLPIKQDMVKKVKEELEFIGFKYGEIKNNLMLVDLYLQDLRIKGISNHYIDISILTEKDIIDYKEFFAFNKSIANIPLAQSLGDEDWQHIFNTILKVFDNKNASETEKDFLFAYFLDDLIANKNKVLPQYVELLKDKKKKEQILSLIRGKNFKEKIEYVENLDKSLTLPTQFSQNYSATYVINTEVFKDAFKSLNRSVITTIMDRMIVATESSIGFKTNGSFGLTVFSHTPISNEQLMNFISHNMDKWYRDERFSFKKELSHFLNELREDELNKRIIECEENRQTDTVKIIKKKI